LQAGVVGGASAGPAGVAAEDWVELALHPVPVARVQAEVVPSFVKKKFGPVRS